MRGTETDTHPTTLVPKPPTGAVLKALVYDIEILRAIPPKDPDRRNPAVEYCEGWHDHAGMGVSCICAYDYVAERYRVFGPGNLEDFFWLASEPGRLLVGYNNVNFDNRVLAHAFHAGAFFSPEADSPDNGATYDLLREIWAAAGLSPTFDRTTHAGYGLEDVCRANFDLRKTGNGALAPEQWQRGEYGAVIDYCLNDVYLTKRLFDQVLDELPLQDPKTREALVLRRPQ